MKLPHAAASITLWLLVLSSSDVPLAWAGSTEFRAGDSFLLERQKTWTGDLYLGTRSLDIVGRLEGDLIGFTQSALIDGEIDGDVAILGESLQIDGQVLDSVRFLGKTAIIKGTVQGDLLVFSQMLVIHEGAHITGSLLAFAQTANVRGAVDGDLKFTGGSLTLAGTVGRNARIKADTVDIAPETRIQGNLHYSARKPLELEGLGIVAGQVEFEPKKEEEEEPWITLGGFLWWAWRTTAAMLVGLLVVALFRRSVSQLLASIGREMLIGTLLGFVAFLIVPAAAVLALVLIVSLPLGLLVLILFLVALYLAKLPVAVWLGRRVLSLAGAADPSPFPSLILGLLILYLLFAAPYVGFFIWLLVAWLGLGAMILVVRSRIQERPA